ncbi:DUF368 domain-containing protein [Natronorubrum sp. FCH18a]|uniref:DUF368 domain-containing protein n=1 Tax=Natronorubrum sp. FCH18a TaxID=3447018 RepID=UPI003F519BBC
MRELLVIYLKGFSMGAADVVPGVSGGTIALIVGIYDRMIQAITAIDPRAVRPALRIHEPEARAELRSAVDRMDIPFLIALGLGVATAIVILSRVMHAAATSYPVPTYSFFFGLIAASAVVLYGDVESWTPGRLLISAVAIVIAFLVTGVTASGASHGPLMVFAAGAVAICAMVLPGVSGAFFLLILGQYEYMTGVLSEFVDGMLGLLTGDALSPVLDAGTIVAVFGVGAVIGLFTMAHAVGYALEHYRAATLAFLVSLMVGALRLPVEEVVGNLGETAFGTPTIAVVAGVVGAGSVLLVDRYTDDLEY